MTESKYQFQYAGFWIRVVASIVDSVIVTIGSYVLGFAAMLLVYFVTKPEGGLIAAFTGTQIQFIQFGASVFLAIPYYITFHYKWGSTPGKRMFKIVVRDYQTGGALTLGQSAGRYFATIISGITLGVGYLMVGFHPKKRALHELISGTVSLIEDDSSVFSKEPPTETSSFEAQS